MAAARNGGRSRRLLGRRLAGGAARSAAVLGIAAAGVLGGIGVVGTIGAGSAAAATRHCDHGGGHGTSNGAGRASVTLTLSIKTRGGDHGGHGGPGWPGRGSGGAPGSGAPGGSGAGQGSGSSGQWGRPVPLRTVKGVVASVGTDSFTITRGHLATITVDVSSSTTYSERGQSSASFSDLAVGERVEAAGTVSSGALDASKVFIVTNSAVEESGVVASLGTDSFTITRGGLATITVDVLTSTAFSESGVTDATFANLKVGDRVEVTGTVSNGALDASQVEIATVPLVARLGIVASLGTDSFTLSSGASSSGASGQGASRTVTVDVSSTTAYLEAGVSSVSFASLAVNDQVVVVGTNSGQGTVQASTVVILSS